MLVDKIKNDIKVAMKNKNKTELVTLRNLLSVIETERSRVGIDDISNFSDDDIVKFVQRSLKIIEQEIEGIKLSRPDSNTGYQNIQKSILKKYLPKQMPHEEIEKEVKKSIGLVESGKYKNPMQYLSKSLRGKANMSEVANIVKEYSNRHM